MVDTTDLKSVSYLRSMSSSLIKATLFKCYNMIIGSHNSWSYLPVKEWWIRPFIKFRRCQLCDIKTLYERHGVKCFDLHIKFKNKLAFISYNGICFGKLPKEDLRYLNEKKDVKVRIMLDTTSTKLYTKDNILQFRVLCSALLKEYRNIEFFGGKVADTYKSIYYFDYIPHLVEQHYSVNKNMLFGWPKLYSKRNNKLINYKYEKAFNRDSSLILMMDFVDIY